MENLEQLQNFVQFSSEHTMPSGVRWGFGLELLTAFITFGSIMRNSIIKMQLKMKNTLFGVCPFHYEGGILLYRWTVLL